jgi:aminomethyltransferase
MSESRGPLHEDFASLGARFFVERGRELPLSFAGFETEYQAARGSVVLVDRSHRGLLQVTGKDRVSYLQNMLSNDVKGLAPGSGLHAAWLNRQGKLLADMWVYRLDDAILLDLEQARAQPTVESLGRYIVSEDVQLQDVSAERALVSIEGPGAKALLDALLRHSLPALGRFGIVERSTEGIAVRLSAVPHGPGPSFDVSVAVGDASRFLALTLEAGKPLGLVPAGHRVAETRRVEAGLPRYGFDMDENHFPLEAALEDALSFTKGCYIGQEYVARLAHRGHVNRKLTGITIEGGQTPRAGDPLMTGDQAVGQVTSAHFSPAVGAHLALAYVHKDWLSPGTELSVVSGTFASPARVTALPFLSGA